MFENQIKEGISKVTRVNKKEIFLKIPKAEFGDFSYACFIPAKKRKKNPNQFAQELAKKIKIPGIQVKAVGGYINFFVNKEKFSEQLIKLILKEKAKYGSSKGGKNKKIVIDFSSPNIAKPFNIGHLRSTIIGYSLYKIFNHLGYKSVGINHLGDWGTQFGQLITAYKKWGKEPKLKKEPIKYLLDLYVKFNKKSANKEELYDKAKEEFKKLEQGDKQNTLLWKKFRDLSLKEFSKIYKILNIHFDSYAGESFYNNQLEKTINLLGKKGITKTSEGALIIPVGNMPPCILKKSDGASTYHTRELAALFYRNSKYNPEKILYIVGSEQKLHFQQVFKALNIAGFNWYDHCIHVPFGLIRLEEGKLSTRAGRVIFMEQVIEKGIILAKKIIQKKNPKLKNKDKVAKDIAIGAIIYGDLSNDRILNIRFDWTTILAFEGNSGPYLQYSIVRANSILKKVKSSKSSGKINFKNLHEKEYILIKELSLFPEIIKRAARNFKPNIIANYTYSIARLFNDFYECCPVIKAKAEEKARRIAIVKATKQVLENCFNLLLIPILQEM
jgi:arginyl-tRNA synthetase